MESTESAQTAENLSFVTHVVTRHLRWATVFASLIALCKMRDELLPADLLAGIYVANADRVSQFWQHPESFDDLVAEHCDWSEPRWLTFQRWQDETRHAARRFRFPFGISLVLLRKKNRHLFDSRFTQSAEWKRLFDTGERLTAYKVAWRNGILPLLTPEVMLLAFMRTDETPLGKSLQDSGLMVDRLEQAATRHINHPEKLMF
jgi:hypothetical protein